MRRNRSPYFRPLRAGEEERDSQPITYIYKADPFDPVSVSLNVGHYLNVFAEKYLEKCNLYADLFRCRRIYAVYFF